jgi:hypothetical protein
MTFSTWIFCKTAYNGYASRTSAKPLWGRALNFRQIKTSHKPKPGPVFPNVGLLLKTRRI